MMPQKRQKQQPQGVEDSGGSGGGESSGMTMTTKTGNEDYDAGWVPV
jgi:hypothetical protein